MTLEPYTPPRSWAEEIGATALKMGVIQLTVAAYGALGKPAFVEVDLDRDACAIHVRLAAGDPERAIAVRQVRRFAATGLLRTAGIDYRPRSVRLPGRMVGRTTLVLDYGEAPAARHTPGRRPA